MKVSNKQPSPLGASEYLQQISEVLLYLLLPPADFQNQVTRIFLRELIANIVLLPVVDLITDPDYINQTIVWMVRQRNKGLYKGDDKDVGTFIFLSIPSIKGNPLPF